MKALILILKCVLVWAGLAFTSMGVGAAGRSGILVWMAIPFAGVLVFVWRLLGRRAEHVAWAIFLLFLGLTYINPTSDTLTRELIVFAVYVVLSVAGLLISPWFIALGFAAHIGWDFVPRDLPTHLMRLPIACLLFDGAIAAYIAWQTYTERWRSLRHAVRPVSPAKI